MKHMRPGEKFLHLYRMGGLTPAIASMFNERNAQQMAFIRSIIKEQRKNALYDIRLETAELVVFDLETTGFSPYNGDEIISFGAVMVKGGETLEDKQYYSLVNPNRTIPPEIEKLTGISNETAAQAPELIQALRGFMEFAGRYIWVAHGTGHDKRFLQSALWKTSKVQLSHRILDTMLLAKWLHPASPRHDLDAMLDMYGIPVGRRHHALEDAIMTARLWSRLLHDIQERGIFTLGELYSRLSLHE